MSHTAVCACSPDSSSVLYREKKKTQSLFAPQGASDTKEMNHRTFTMTEIPAIYSSGVWRKWFLCWGYWRACCSCTFAPSSPLRKITDVTSCALQMYTKNAVLEAKKHHLHSEARGRLLSAGSEALMRGETTSQQSTGQSIWEKTLKASDE